MDDLTVGELAAWKRRIDDAQLRTEPVYVTHDEYRQLRELEAARQQEEDPRRGLAGDGILRSGVIGVWWSGVPVIVDDEKARAQRLEEGS
jgi:hypothetical protein